VPYRQPLFDSWTVRPKYLAVRPTTEGPLDAVAAVPPRGEPPRSGISRFSDVRTMDEPHHAIADRPPLQHAAARALRVDSAERSPPSASTAFVACSVRSARMRLACGSRSARSAATSWRWSCRQGCPDRDRHPRRRHCSARARARDGRASSSASSAADSDQPSLDSDAAGDRLGWCLATSPRAAPRGGSECAALRSE